MSGREFLAGVPHGLGEGTLGRRFINHPAALAPTARLPVDLANLPKPGKAAEYPRASGAPFVVAREASGFGVYLDERRVGGQYSFPDADDCERMLGRAVVEPIEKRLSTEARFALSLGLPAIDRKKRSAARARALDEFRASTRRIFRKRPE